MCLLNKQIIQGTLNIFSQLSLQRSLVGWGGRSYKRLANVYYWTPVNDIQFGFFSLYPHYRLFACQYINTAYLQKKFNIENNKNIGLTVNSHIKSYLTMAGSFPI